MRTKESLWGFFASDPQLSFNEDGEAELNGGRLLYTSELGLEMVGGEEHQSREQNR